MCDVDNNVAVINFYFFKLGKNLISIWVCLLCCRILILLQIKHFIVIKF